MRKRTAPFVLCILVSLIFLYIELQKRTDTADQSGIFKYEHRPQRHWVLQKSIFPKINRTTTIQMKEVYLPCAKNEYGTNSVQIHVCIISLQTTKYFDQFQHAALTVFPCWSWFAEKQAINCAFLIQDGLYNSWLNNFIALKMGCLILKKKPAQCALLGTLSQRPETGLGENLIWLSSYSDAEILQNLSFHRHPKNKGIGIIDRKANRRIRNVFEMNITKDIAYFEDLSYFDQALWFHEHDIIIAAHGAAITHSVFIRRCTVIIQLYPDHYFRTSYYKQLLDIMGAISMPWMNTKFIANNATSGVINDALLKNDYELHAAKADYWRKKDITIDKTEVLRLLTIAEERQTNCRKNPF